MNEELLEHKVKTHEQRINNHSDRLDKIENRQANVDMLIQIFHITEAIECMVTSNQQQI